MKSSETRIVSTPTATLAMYDPARLAHRSEEEEWFLYEERVTEEIRHGNIVIVNAPMGGEYSVRFSKAGPRKAEAPHVVGTGTSWIVISSGVLACSDLGCVPARSPRTYCKENAAEVRLRPGRYRLELSALSIEAGLDELPHLVIAIAPITEGERAPKRSATPLELWNEQRSCARQKPESKPTRGHPATSRGGGAAVLEGVLPFRRGVGAFDPAHMAALSQRRTGWASDESELQTALKAGELVFIRSIGEGFHEAEISLSLGDPPRDLRDGAVSTRCGRLRVTSGEVAFVNGDRIDAGKRARAPQKRWTATVPKGDHAVEIIVGHPAPKTPRRASYSLWLTPWNNRKCRVSLPENVYARTK